MLRLDKNCNWLFIENWLPRVDLHLIDFNLNNLWKNLWNFVLVPYLHHTFAQLGVARNHKDFAKFYVNKYS